jgi:hypothetical protein
MSLVVTGFVSDFSDASGLSDVIAAGAESFISITMSAAGKPAEILATVVASKG